MSEHLLPCPFWRNCFGAGRCLRACTAQKKRDEEKRVADLEQRVRWLEQEYYRLTGKAAEGERNHG
ncbi:hypothetical protein [Cupriavidus gilardii]|uniref:hypothetical protein n=1 Tax=Cupriavidus gilardii TaxID=82541 RepID=UPI0021B47BC8|nr:hypothetical protein [Cupriavidus gilardii]UXC37170.1 hypothetical protein N4G38_06915 [Cupriavidus gilardii]